MKFGRKLMYLDYLHELAQHLQLDQLIIPPAVRKSVPVLAYLSVRHHEQLSSSFCHSHTQVINLSLGF